MSSGLPPRLVAEFVFFVDPGGAISDIISSAVVRLEKMALFIIQGMSAFSSPQLWGMGPEFANSLH